MLGSLHIRSLILTSVSNEYVELAGLNFILSFLFPPNMSDVAYNRNANDFQSPRRKYTYIYIIRIEMNRTQPWSINVHTRNKLKLGVSVTHFVAHPETSLHCPHSCGSFVLQFGLVQEFLLVPAYY